jgi:RNA polymerase sigma-70 factor, ECF subfamily
MDDRKRLIANEAPALRRYARVLVKDPDRADDLAQDCLERALRKRHLWHRTGSLRAWLFSMLHNLHINVGITRARRPKTVPIDDMILAQPPQQIPLVELREVARALDALPAAQREVLLLVAVYGVSYEEAAATLGVPVGTVRSRLSRARVGLQAPASDRVVPFRKVR